MKNRRRIHAVELVANTLRNSQVNTCC